MIGKQEALPMRIETENVYTRASMRDSYRVLIDRRWPRGRGKVQPALDAWARELAPGTALRQWFAHDARVVAAGRPLRLIYAARDAEHDHARVLLRRCCWQTVQTHAEPIGVRHESRIIAGPQAPCPRGWPP